MVERTQIFVDEKRKEVRVLLEPDGTPLFCGVDVAKLAGYTAPNKAISGGNNGRNEVPTVKRRMVWNNGKKSGNSVFIFFTADNAVRFLNRKPAPQEVLRWFTRTVIPEASAIGNKYAADELRKDRECDEKKTEKKNIENAAKDKSLADRLDAIILECILMKQEISRI